MKGLHVFSFQVNGIMGPCIFHPSIFHPENNSLPGFSMNNALFLKPKRHSFDFPLCLAFWVIFKQGNSRTWNVGFINIFTWSSNSSLAIISWYLKYFFFPLWGKSKVLYLLENEAPWTVFKVNSSLKPRHICVFEQRAWWGYFSPLFSFPCWISSKKKACIQNRAVWRLNLLCLHFTKLTPWGWSGSTTPVPAWIHVGHCPFHLKIQMHFGGPPCSCLLAMEPDDPCRVICHGLKRGPLVLLTHVLLAEEPQQIPG